MSFSGMFATYQFGFCPGCASCKVEPDNVEWGRITAGLFDIHMTRSCLPALARVFPDAASFLCTGELPVRHSPAPEASAWITGVALMDRLPVPSLLPWLLTERSALGTHAQASRQRVRSCCAFSPVHSAHSCEGSAGERHWSADPTPTSQHV